MKSVVKRVGKRYWKNLVFINSVVAAFAAVVLVVLVWQNRDAVEREAYLIEQQKLGQANNSLSAAFDQISRINNYFASLTLYGGDPDFAASWYPEIDDRATFGITLFNYIRSISVKNGDAEYQKGVEIRDVFSISRGGGSLHHLGVINATDIFFNGEVSADKLYFSQTPGAGSYAENTVVLSIDSVYLYQSLLGTTSDREFRCVVSENGSIILTDRAGLLQENLLELYGLKNGGISVGNRNIRSGGKEYFFCTSRVGDLNLYTVSLTERGVYGSHYQEMILRMTLLALLVLGASLVLGRIITIRTYKPIRLLLKSLDSFFPQDYLNKSVDEINYLAERLGQIYKDNTRLSQAVREDMLRLRNQQVAALQAQISPHFVYNTLDAINWISIGLIGFSNPISQCVLNTADILKSGMDFSSLFDSLEKEIDITKKYIEVLKIRYDNSFDVAWDADETLFDCTVLKICMQPVVENMAFHGLCGQEERGVITIRIREEADETLRIEIRDNGKGIEPERLEELRGTIDDTQSPSASHIGLRNVNLRLKLLYGDRYGVEIGSVRGEGTVCTLKMPVSRY